MHRTFRMRLQNYNKYFYSSLLHVITKKVIKTENLTFCLDYLTIGSKKTFSMHSYYE